MSFDSLLRYRDVLLREARGKLRGDRIVSLRMKEPIRGTVLLREYTSDLLTFEEVVLERVYEPISRVLTRCSTIIDLGANIGLASRYLATCYSSSQIFAVEPHPANYAILVANLRDLSKAGRCKCLHAAVWDSEKPLVIDSSPTPTRYNSCTVRESTPGEQGLSELSGLTIDKIIELSGFANVDLLKVDIEGAERELFRGNLDWLRRVGVIAIEFHGEARSSANFDGIMKEYGFAIRDAERHTVLAIRKTA
jgi:FkbM family methyltransferase